MKRTIQVTLFSVCMVAYVAMAENYELEPCVNGEVSASGLFPTQEAEDRFIISQLQASNWDLEPCINGDVSSSGMFPNQDAEDRYHVIQTDKYGKVK